MTYLAHRLAATALGARRQCPIWSLAAIHFQEISDLHLPLFPQPEKLARITTITTFKLSARREIGRLPQNNSSPRSSSGNFNCRNRGFDGAALPRPES